MLGDAVFVGRVAPEIRENRGQSFGAHMGRAQITHKLCIRARSELRERVEGRVARGTYAVTQAEDVECDVPSIAVRESGERHHGRTRDAEAHGREDAIRREGIGDVGVVKARGLRREFGRLRAISLARRSMTIDAILLEKGFPTRRVRRRRRRLAQSIESGNARARRLGSRFNLALQRLLLDERAHGPNLGHDVGRIGVRRSGELHGNPAGFVEQGELLGVLGRSDDRAVLNGAAIVPSDITEDVNETLRLDLRRVAQVGAREPRERHEGTHPEDDRAHAQPEASADVDNHIRLSSGGTAADQGSPRAFPIKSGRTTGDARRSERPKRRSSRPSGSRSTAVCRPMALPPRASTSPRSRPDRAPRR